MNVKTLGLLLAGFCVLPKLWADVPAPAAPQGAPLPPKSISCDSAFEQRNALEADLRPHATFRLSQEAGEAWAADLRVAKDIASSQYTQLILKGVRCAFVPEEPLLLSCHAGEESSDSKETSGLHSKLIGEKHLEVSEWTDFEPAAAGRNFFRVDAFHFIRYTDKTRGGVSEKLEYSFYLRECSVGY